MASESHRAWSNARLLYTATETLRKGGEAVPHAASTHKRERKQHRKPKETISVIPDTGEAQGNEGEHQEEAPTPGDSGEEHVGQERLAHLRSQLQAQLSREQQEDHSSGSQIIELVEKVFHGEVENGEVPEDGSSDPGSTAGSICATCGQHSTPGGCTNGVPSELEKKLKKELTALREDVTASIKAMRKDMAEELKSLREVLKASSEHPALQTSELSPLEEQDETTSDPLKSPHYGVRQREKLGVKLPATLEEKYKSRSVPSLHPLPGPSRNQALLRAMTTITAKNALTGTIGPRSNSDPVEPLPIKHTTVLPPANLKPTLKKHPKKVMTPSGARSHQENEKRGNKVTARMVTPHPPLHTDGNPH
ncbi:uncharacterized protein LOC132243442 [Alligator mississippiensis]|uniref:uncharacterized protein LOC132243442 n=1 Tax=Alligator mississippiensis TaxID=8496 RepID=UPI0028778121|nr:uncharacterized protein LOC132243442 [Alligator mississippiensis]